MHNSMQKIYVLFFSAVLFGLPFAASASGIQVSPAHLEFSVQRKVVTSTIEVKNPTTDVQIFRVYADEFTRAISVSPSTFTLNANEVQTVQVFVDPTDLRITDGVTTTTVSVVGSPSMQGISPVGAGAKVVVQIHSTEKGVYDKGVWVGLILLLLLGLYLVWKAITRKNKG